MQIILGIDLGTYSVKISQIERGFGEFKLVNFYEVPLVGEEVLTYEQAAAAALIRFFENNPIHYDTCSLSIPGNLVSFRNLEVPFSSTRKIDSVIEFEMEAVVPFDVEKLHFDYSFLSSQPNRSELLVAYLHIEVFKKILQQIQNSGIEPRYVGVDTLDLSYLKYTGLLPAQGQFALLDLGHTKSNLLVFEGDRLLGARCISWGGIHLTHALAKAMNIPIDQAENYKHNQLQWNINGDDPVSVTIGQCLDDLKIQLKQTLFSFYEKKAPPLEAFYLMGGTSKLAGIDNFFSNIFNINVSHLDVLDDRYTTFFDREKARPIIPNSLAQALRAVFPNKGIKMNFRRGEFAYKKDIELLGGSFKKAGALAASVAALGLIYFIVAYFSLSSQAGKMNQSMTKLLKSAAIDVPKTGKQSPTATVSLLNGKITSLEDKLKKVQGGGHSSLDILKMISASMPQREELVIDIDDLNISPDRVRMEGRTVSYEGVDKVKASMEKIKIFKNVQTGNVRKGVRDEIRFSLSFDVVS